MNDNYELIAGYPVTLKGKDETIAEILLWVEKGAEAKYFVCLNPHSVQMVQRDVASRKALEQADLILPDGIGICMASWMLGGKIFSRITGSDVFWGLSVALNERHGYRYFFLGSTEENLTKIAQKMGEDFPHINVVGTYSPPFKSDLSEEEDSSIIDQINRLEPDVLWIGMTAPKQEQWAYRCRDRLKVKVIGPIGAVFSFYGGSEKRPPPLFLESGLEWLARLLRQPRRLFYRSFLSNPTFLMRIVTTRLSTRHHQAQNRG